MKKIEIKKLGLFSVFKATMYMMLIPVIFYLIIGLFMFLIGMASGQGRLIFTGLIYGITFIFALPIAGLMNMLAGLIYNAFASKFGGLEIEIKEENDLL